MLVLVKKNVAYGAGKYKIFLLFLSEIVMIIFFCRL